MKKLCIMLSMLALTTLSAFAQEVTMSEDGMTATYTKQTETGLATIYRSGNTYIMGNQVMNKYQYAAHLQNTCPAAFVKFNQGYNLSSAGWGLLAGGLALTTTAVGMGFAHPVKDQALPYHHAMDCLYWTGNALLTASVPLLIVGYCKQHASVGVYNNCNRAEAYFSVNLSNNGIGIAYNY